MYFSAVDQTVLKAALYAIKYTNAANQNESQKILLVMCVMSAYSQEETLFVIRFSLFVKNLKA